MSMTTRIELTILLSGLLACSVKGSFGGSDTAPLPDGTTGYGDSEASTAATEGGTSTSAGPASDTDVVSSSVPATSDTTAVASDTDWAGTTLVETGEVSDTHWGTTLAETGGISDTDSDTHATTTPYTTGEPEPCEGEAVPIEAELLAYAHSQIDASPDDGTTGGADDPSLLYVRFSDQTFTCADPHDRLACGHHWELSLRLPPAFQTPGLYSLEFADVTPHAFGVSTGTDLGGEDCDGAGSVAKGTVQVIAIDEDKVVGRLCHVSWFGLDGDFELDGSFIAPRCSP